MSDLKKVTLTVKNYNLKASGDLDALYSQVRCEDPSGKTFHFKEVVMLGYLKRHGAIATDIPVTWYYKHLAKKSIVIIAFQKASGKVEFDLDNMQQVVKSSIMKGVMLALAAIPAGLIIATATFGLGLLFIPVGFFYAYRNIFKIPGMLRRRTLVNDLATHGMVVK
ncbi:hypothetical protein KSS94_09340 [Pseudomonas fakonensis]|uniref:Uncharacterized protein n=1 Tax=Pseudomonas fakonensis TaxID=2842355 RepID=A0ABX8NB88_9PSED|nr:hypothetical protein [Pseudomonas fakonensis]QXH53297.1 hypothetical protein KSS94_09340 [Pseudomonas fakonensis]